MVRQLHLTWVNQGKVASSRTQVIGATYSLDLTCQVKHSLKNDTPTNDGKTQIDHKLLYTL